MEEVKKVLQAGGQLVRPDAVVEQLLTDSRNIGSGARALFFAICGVQHDGHQYIAEAHAKGVRNFVVERLIEYGYSDTNFLLVDNSVAALQQLATYHRSQF
ncbi:MAG: Mur ligase domain-containing protein, partial [Chitinophagales bacterium]